MRPTQRAAVRRGTGVALTVLLLAAAIAFVVRAPETAVSEGRAAPSSPSAPVTPTGPANPSTNDPSTNTPSTNDPGTAPSTAAPTTGADGGSGGSGGSGDTSTGPGRTAAGIQLIAQPRSDGDWDVIEYVRLSTPSTTLALSAPAISRLGGQFDGRTAGRSTLQVTAGGQVASIQGTGGQQTIEAPAATDAFVLRYVLTGATVRSVPSTAGRALTALGPIADPGEGQTPVEIITSGSTVRTVQCPLLSGDQQLCQAGDAPNIRVAQPLPRASAIALVQFDLPAPS